MPSVPATITPIMAKIVAISVHLFWYAKVKRMTPVASCRTPKSEMYDIVKLRWECKTAVGLDVTASTVPVLRGK